MKAQHKWFPDSILTDNSTGHVWKYRQPLEDEITEAKLYAREHNLPVTSTCQKYVGTDKRNELVILQEGDSLADRCQALICAIRDTLIIQHEVAVKQKNIGSPIIARNNQIALLFYMLDHYVADGHMPLHCDSRKYNDSMHYGMEEVWEHDLLALYELEPVPRIIIIIDAEKRFILDKQGLPIVKDTEKFQSSHLGKVVKTLENRDFIMGFGRRNNNVWDYMVDVCFSSYLLSTKILPLDIKNPEKFGFNKIKINTW